jgi:hypothetical protein
MFASTSLAKCPLAARRRTPRGQQAEEQSRGEREQHGERHDAHVENRRAGQLHGAGGPHQGDQPFVHPPREHEGAGGADDCQEHAFRKPLTDNAEAGRANGIADRRFAHARGGARLEHATDVGAGHEQQERRDRGGEPDHHAGRFAHVLGKTERRDHGVLSVIEGPREFAPDFSSDAFDIVAGGAAVDVGAEAGGNQQPAPATLGHLLVLRPRLLVHGERRPEPAQIRGIAAGEPLGRNADDLERVPVDVSGPADHVGRARELISPRAVADDDHWTPTEDLVVAGLQHPAQRRTYAE